MKTKKFNSRKQAMDFASVVRGFAEGPFIDENLEQTFIVFYRERRTK